MLAELGLAVGVGLAVGLALAWGVAASRARHLGRLSDQVTRDIEPYLRRRAAELGLEVDRPVWTARHRAEEKIAFSAQLARDLLREARGEDPAHSSTALAQTVPAVDSQAVTAPRRGAGSDARDPRAATEENS